MHEIDGYTLRVLDDPFSPGSPLTPQAWDGLLAGYPEANPFLRHAYLAAMQGSGSATTVTGWTARGVTLWQGGQLAAACMLYLKTHSYGEYVFDWAWANAYAQHGLDYYPKALVAVPFTPVPGPRLLARDTAARIALVRALVAWCEQQRLSSLHLLFTDERDTQSCADAGLMLRHTVQFHWRNNAPTLVASRTALPPEGVPSALGRPGGGMGAPTLFKDFDDFLASLAQDKRKKIRQERRKVADAGVRFRWAAGTNITAADWDFFYRCYERTYLEHGNAPYLSRDFFQRMADTLPGAWLLFIAERDGRPIASSLIAINAGTTGLEESPRQLPNGLKVAYGRYWGALERVDCLHFEACYYQPLAWCIAHGYHRFEGGAQGEHKMARALLPVKTSSAHWLAHPAFADAVQNFLAREGQGIESYVAHLEARSPLRNGG